MLEANTTSVQNDIVSCFAFFIADLIYCGNYVVKCTMTVLSLYTHSTSARALFFRFACTHIHILLFAILDMKRKRKKCKAKTNRKVYQFKFISPSFFLRIWFVYRKNRSIWKSNICVFSNKALDVHINNITYYFDIELSINAICARTVYAGDKIAN